VQRSLAAIDWSAPGLEANAILCVRRVRLSVRGSSLASDSHFAAAAIGGVEESLAVLARSAARPAQAAVTTSANAVLFSDRAELLACLARDWCIGDASTRWWWRVLFPGPDLSDTVLRVWRDETHFAPSALARLDEAGLATRFLARLPAAEIAVLWRNTVVAFDLASLASAWKDISGSAGSRRLAEATGGPAPWSRWVGSHDSLDAARDRLLTVSLLIECAPTMVRSMAFARLVHEWVNHAKPRAPGPTEHGASDATVDDRRSSSPRQAAAEDSNSPAGRAASAANPLARAAQISRPEFSRVLARTTGRSDLPVTRPKRETSSNSGGESPAGMVAGTLEATDASRSAALSREPANTAYPEGGVTPLRPSSPRCRIETAWGGVFYLINVAQALGYYGDFTTPAKPGIDVSPWDFLACFGRRFVGPQFMADPVGALLARLSGRVTDESDEWPEPRVDPPDGEPLEVWLDATEQQLRGRLLAALGDHTADELRALVFARRARVDVTLIDVNVTFSLAEHPIALRLAGLDRDPGWVPAAGRSIAFYYE
jgi:hypothetical protein